MATAVVGAGAGGRKERHRFFEVPEHSVMMGKQFRDKVLSLPTPTTHRVLSIVPTVLSDIQTHENIGTSLTDTIKIDKKRLLIYYFQTRNSKQNCRDVQLIQKLLFLFFNFFVH